MSEPTPYLRLSRRGGRQRGPPERRLCFFSPLSATVKKRVPVSSKATQKRDGVPEISGIPSYSGESPREGAGGGGLGGL